MLIEIAHDDYYHRFSMLQTTVEPDLIVTEMLTFPSKSSRNKNDCDLMIAIP